MPSSIIFFKFLISNLISCCFSHWFMRRESTISSFYRTKSCEFSASSDAKSSSSKSKSSICGTFYVWFSEMAFTYWNLGSTSLKTNWSLIFMMSYSRWLFSWFSSKDWKLLRESSWSRFDEIVSLSSIKVKLLSSGPFWKLSTSSSNLWEFISFKGES